MVLINGVKYACEKCIRGHRATTCTDSDKPLIMIKPKGRPSTSCIHCKEQRLLKNSNPSGVCNCNNNKKISSCNCKSTGKCICHSHRNTNNNNNNNNNNIPIITSNDDRLNFLNLNNNNLDIGLYPLSNTKEISQFTRTNVGEVKVSLEEYLPYEIDGIGHIDTTKQSNTMIPAPSINNTPTTNTNITNNNNGLITNNNDNDSLLKDLLMNNNDNDLNINFNTPIATCSKNTGNNNNTNVNVSSSEDHNIAILSLTPSFLDMNNEEDSNVIVEKNDKEVLPNNLSNILESDAGVNTSFFNEFL